MRFSVLFLLFLAGAARAQDAGVQRALIRRDQQSAAFGLQLRQSQEALKGNNAGNSATLESRQLWDRQQLDNLNGKQLLEIRPETPEALRPYERSKLDAESRPFRYPIVEVPVQRPAPLPRLKPSLKGNVDLIEAPR